MRTEDRVIGEHTFRISQLESRKSLEVFAQLIQFAGPSLAALIESGDLPNVKAIGDVDTSAVGKALREVCSRALAADVLHFWSVFEEHTRLVVGDKSEPLKKVSEAIFPGNVQTQIALMWAHLEVNYRGFFVDVRGFVNTLRPPEKGAKDSPSSSTG
jgi:hypothetical protein